MTDDLTGVWNGTYVQSRVGMVTFLATLIETGGALGGNVTEPCIRPDCLVGGTHNASIAVIDPAARSRSSNVTSRLAAAMTRSFMKAWSMLTRRKSMGAGGCRERRHRGRF
jgi:hypothetical protein